MEKLRIKLIDSKKIEPKEGQCEDLIRSSKRSITHCPSFGLSNINNFINFAVSLKKIHTRLLMEGYVIKDGKIYKPDL